MADQIAVITDTSVLVNFLCLDKVSLLVALAGRKFVITDHVRAEITDHYPDQLRRLEQALVAGHLEEIAVTDISEVALFATLTTTGLGIGECSAIAVAVIRNWAIAIDDKTACKRIAKLFPALTVLTTESLMVSLIQAGALTVAEADTMKSDWEMNYRFRLSFGSFAEKLTLPGTSR